MRVGVADIVDMFGTYGRTLGRGIGDYIPDPTAIFGVSDCPPGYQSDGRMGCVTAGIGPAPPPGYVDPNFLLNCGPGTYAVNGQCVATNAYLPSGSPSPTAVPATAPKPIASLSKNQLLIIGAGLVIMFMVLLPAAGGRR